MRYEKWRAFSLLHYEHYLREKVSEIKHEKALKNISS